MGDGDGVKERRPHPGLGVPTGMAGNIKPKMPQNNDRNGTLLEGVEMRAPRPPRTGPRRWSAVNGREELCDYR